MKKYIKLMLLVAAISVGIAGGFFLYQHNTAIQKQMAVQKEAERIKFVAEKLKTVKITSSLDGAVQNAYYYRTHSNEKRPLIVMLHTWCGTYKSLHEANSPIPPQQVFTLDWNYIQPDFRGKNDHPDACGSEKTVPDIDQAIDYAVSQGNVDTNKIYIVGASGGAYQGLVYFMKSKKQVAGYELWVPVSDLIAFYYQGMSQRHSYDGDILKCTSSQVDMLNFDEAARRSPIYMQTPLEKLRQRTFLKFYAGVHDGEKDLIVPISHSIRMYNKILKDEGIKDANKYVPRSDMIYMLQNFAAPRQQQLGKLQGGQEIVYRKNTGLVSLVIFDGGHDIDFDQVFADLQKDVVKRNE